MASKLEILETLDTASKTELGYTFMKPSQYKKVVADGLAQINEAIKDATGMVATAITPAGHAFLAELEAKPAAAAPTQYVLKTAPIPETKRKAGAGRPSKYPFATMTIGEYFFVPDSVKCQDPAKSLTSIVASTNRRYATESATETRVNRKGATVPVLIYTKKFVVRPFNETDSKGNIVNGAGVWREK